MCESERRRLKNSFKATIGGDMGIEEDQKAEERKEIKELYLKLFGTDIQEDL